MDKRDIEVFLRKLHAGRYIESHIIERAETIADCVFLQAALDDMRQGVATKSHSKRRLIEKHNCSDDLYVNLSGDYPCTLLEDCSALIDAEPVQAAETSGGGKIDLSWIEDDKDRETITKLIDPDHGLIKPEAINKKFPVKRGCTKEIVRYLLNNGYNENTGFLFMQRYIGHDINTESVVNYFREVKKDIPVKK